MRGKVNEDLKIEDVLKFTKKFALWLGKGSKVALGRDTRNSSLMYAQIIASGLISMGIHVTDLLDLPTPIILHYIHLKKLAGGVIITGSHNPEEYNGVKFVGPSHTFINNEEIEEIQKLSLKGVSSEYPAKWDEIGLIHSADAKKLYKSLLNKELDIKNIKKRGLKVIVDTNAGTAKGVIDIFLSSYGCILIHLHEKFNITNDSSMCYPHFPRKIEPIAENLEVLKLEMKKTNADVGFAYDCDADRLTVVGPDGEVYPEDVSVLLPMHYFLHRNALKKSPKKILIVTNIASSLAFDDLAEKFGAKIYRTQIGEQYLARKFTQLKLDNPGTLIIGGEGSSGGFMYPRFNNARDGIFASCVICDCLSQHSESLSELIKNIPKYSSYRESFTVPKSLKIIDRLKIHLEEENLTYIAKGNDVKIINKKRKEWILVHQSNTEPVIRVIAEAKEASRAKSLVKQYRVGIEKKNQE
ncbi:MAG: hypothetical protein JW776_11085 [Candidatus Lokiarchaeota archaeon]|nr:hypothetical protein [Candidatus Lokiarchaeota archaeon]